MQYHLMNRCEAHATKYAGKLDVLNRGMAGYTSTQLLRKLSDNPQFPCAARVRLFVIAIGTNDWWVHPTPPRLYVTDQPNSVIRGPQHVGHV